MKKICILSAVNIRHMTLISLYTERLKRDGIDYDIIYMDKYGKDEEFDAKNKYVFTNIINQSSSRLKKGLQYFKFKKFAIPILEMNKYDFIIVWNDVAIFMFAPYLAKKWKGRYCLNIRDYMYEKNLYIYLRFKRVINNSAFTTISSEGFKKFLPHCVYLHVHSYNKKILDAVTTRLNFRENGKPIRITFIGYVRYYEINKKLCEIFKNDSRFELHYYGTNAEYLEKYSEEKGIQNVTFFNTFPVSETAKYIAKTDIINNLYGNDNINLQNAVSIKLYYGICNRTPILVFKDTYMAEVTSRYGISFVVDKIDTFLPDKIYEWYSTLDYDVFNKNCERALHDIEQNHKDFEDEYVKHILGS